MGKFTEILADRGVCELVPFGKYRGQPAQVLQSDRPYAEWLLKQPWFSEQYGGIKTLIVNNFKEAADSPVHNELQARFLDKKFAYSVTLAAKKRTPFDVWRATFPANIKTRDGTPPREVYEVQFEDHGWDVVVECRFNCECYEMDVSGGNSLRLVRFAWGGIVFFEIKPTIGDDYPSVLRQVKAREDYEGSCVLVEKFEATTVSFEDVREIFRSSGICLLRLCDVEFIDPPQWIVDHGSTEKKP